MTEFNQHYVIKEIEKNYHETFPKKKIKTTVLSYGFKNDKTKSIVNMFFCFDPDHELIGFAVNYGSKKILRFYNHEGEDMGLEFNMSFNPLKKGTVLKSNKRKKK